MENRFNAKQRETELHRSGMPQQENLLQYARGYGPREHGKIRGGRERYQRLMNVQWRNEASLQGHLSAVVPWVQLVTVSSSLPISEGPPSPITGRQYPHALHNVLLRKATCFSCQESSLLPNIS